MEEVIAMEGIVKSFSDSCNLAYECWQMHKIMCEYKDKIKDNSGIWARFGTILHHYLILQIAKINDREKHGKDYNLSLKYFVDYVNKASYTDSYNKFLEDNKEFIEANNNARVKVVAHCDLKVFTSDVVVGAFSTGLDEKYFNSLHEIISEGYRELGLDFSPEWPSFIEKDTKIFMNKIEKTFNA
jgi:coenzyme F420-reducing hydrogenase alpha subunit